jgi:hypothetical protein
MLDAQVTNNIQPNANTNRESKHQPLDANLKANKKVLRFFVIRIT